MRTMPWACAQLLKTLVASAALLVAVGGHALDFREGHFYATSGQAITQYDADGELVASRG